MNTNSLFRYTRNSTKQNDSLTPFFEFNSLYLSRLLLQKDFRANLISNKMGNIKFTVTEDLWATRGQRFVNCILDLLIVHIIIVSLATTVVIVGNVVSNYDLSKWIESTSTFERVLLWMIILFLYYFLSEVYFSRTFAKYFTKTIVVTKKGSRPNKRAISIRTFTRFIPLEALTFLGSNVRGLHDMFSDTYVVKKYEFNHKKGMVAFP